MSIIFGISNAMFSGVTLKGIMLEFSGIIYLTLRSAQRGTSTKTMVNGLCYKTIFVYSVYFYFHLISDTFVGEMLTFRQRSLGDEILLLCDFHSGFF